MPSGADEIITNAINDLKISKEDKDKIFSRNFEKFIQN